MNWITVGGVTEWADPSAFQAEDRAECGVPLRPSKQEIATSEMGVPRSSCDAEFLSRLWQLGVILARQAVTPMTAGLPPATDALLQRGELAKSAKRRHSLGCKPQERGHQLENVAGTDDQGGQSGRSQARATDRSALWRRFPAVRSPVGMAADVVMDHAGCRFRKLRFVRIDGAIRRGSDAQQCLRTARLGVCRAHPSRAKCELVLHCNRCCISQEFAEGALR